MKLFARYNRIFIPLAVLVFLISSIIYYFLLNYILLKEVDEVLSHRRIRMENFVRARGTLPADRMGEVLVYYTFLTKPIAEVRSFVTLYDSIEKKNAPFRKYIFTLPVKDKYYQVTLARPLAGTRDLLTTIILVTFATIMSILFISAIINRIVLRRLWKPFYETIGAMRRYKLGKVKDVQLPQTTIEEFVFLNENLKDTIQKADEDYLILKEFSENASHELQTPLAIIRSKLDLLVQREDLSEYQSEELKEIYGAVKKMSRLSGSLLLLTKIENQQFEQVTDVDLRQTIEEKVKQFQELWNTNQLNLNVHLEEAVIYANEDLIEILLNNLLSNASRHNSAAGSIDIFLRSHELIISNPGSKHLDTRRIFRRFYKEETNSHSNGLGLSIIKQICEESDIQIAYFYRDGKHVFQLNW
jgi:signal transduction histidine kinase